MIDVEIVYASPTSQIILTCRVVEGASVEAAVLQSGILTQFPEIDWPHAVVGIFGKRCEKTQPCQAGDRIEIYRELLIDPKQKRRLLAKAQHKRRLSN